MQITCWVQVCWQKSKCLTHSCQEQQLAVSNSNSLRKKSANPRAMPDGSGDSYMFKDASIQVVIEDPNNAQLPAGAGHGNSQSKNEILPNVIGNYSLS